MRVVNKNVESKRDIISELKNIKVNSTNKIRFLYSKYCYDNYYF